MTTEDYLQTVHQLVVERNVTGICSNYPTVHSFILAKGRYFTSEFLSTAEVNQTNLIGWKSHKKKQCFYNTQMSAIMGCDPEAFRYVEGYVMANTPIPIPHAWLSLNGKVIDTTLRTDPEDDTKRVFGAIPEGWEYYGVPLQISECLHAFSEHRASISIIDDYLCRWPIITKAAASTRQGKTP